MRLFQSVGPFKPMFWFSAKKTAVGRKCFLTESCQGTDIKGTDPIQTGGLSPSFLPGALEGSILGPQGNAGLLSTCTTFSRSPGVPAPRHQDKGYPSVWTNFFTSRVPCKVWVLTQPCRLRQRQAHNRSNQRVPSSPGGDSWRP